MNVIHTSLPFDLAALDPDMKAGTGGGRWAMLKKLVATREMPPADRPKLSDAEVKAVTDWIAGELKRSGRHFSARAEFANGNKVPHDKLFDPNFKAKFDSPSGLRRLSPEVYAANFITAGGVLAQPFTAAGGFAFKDMGAAKLDEPTAVLLIRNAMQHASGQTGFSIDGDKKKFANMVPPQFPPLFDESTNSVARVERNIRGVYDHMKEGIGSAAGAKMAGLKAGITTGVVTLVKNMREGRRDDHERGR